MPSTPCCAAQIVVFTGLLDLLDERDELAAVLGHEAGHVVARHHVRLPRQATALLARTRVCVPPPPQRAGLGQYAGIARQRFDI